MKPLIDDVQVYGLEKSIKASKYPFAIDPDKATTEITERTIVLGCADKGSGHDNFLKGIIVQFDLTCTNKMWVEAERYHFFDIVSSQSTMHRIAKFDLAGQCSSYVEPVIVEILSKLVEDYKENPTPENYLRLLYSTPSGLRLTARITTNYQQLKTIYYQRKDHRLPEWREFCQWILTLPHFKELCVKEYSGEDN